jgi:hypothetical protein
LTRIPFRDELGWFDRYSLLPFIEAGSPCHEPIAKKSRI